MPDPIETKSTAEALEYPWFSEQAEPFLRLPGCQRPMSSFGAVRGLLSSFSSGGIQAGSQMTGWNPTQETASGVFLEEAADLQQTESQLQAEATARSNSREPAHCQAVQGLLGHAASPQEMRHQPCEAAPEFVANRFIQPVKNDTGSSSSCNRVAACQEKKNAMMGMEAGTSLPAHRLRRNLTEWGIPLEACKVG